MPDHRHAVLLALLPVLVCTIVFAHPAAAQTWRCGSTYSDRPCEGGKPFTAADPRDSAQRRDADAAIRKMQATADHMAEDRLRQERSATGRQAILMTRSHEPNAPTAPRAATAPKRPGKPKADARAGARGTSQGKAAANFIAQGPGTGVKKKERKEKAKVPKKATAKAAHASE